MQRTISSAADGADLLSMAASFLEHHRQLGCQFCHGTPGDVREFVFPEDIYDERKLSRVARNLDQTLFPGHTHLPGLFVLPSVRQWEYLEMAPGQQYDLRECAKRICNVGSVWQPRDGAPRASYVLFDGQVIHFHRVDYDIDTRVAKLKHRPDIDDLQGGRLP